MQKTSFFNRLIAKLPHQGSRSIELDFVRGVAILLVLGIHAYTVPTDNWLFQALQYPGKKFGGVGVDLFFVLSGFLVGGLLMKEFKQTGALDVRKFIFRRGFKIWPAYYFFILLEVVFHAHPLGTFLWQNLLHVQNYFGSTIYHTWSLAVEEHFYLVLALAMGWMTRKQWSPRRMLKLFAVVMVVTFVVRTIGYFTLGLRAAQEQTQNRLDGLVCGVALALIFHFFPERFKAMAERAWLLTAIVAVTVAYLCLPKQQAVYSTIGYTIVYIGAAAFLLLVYTHSARISEWWIYRLIAAIGVYSYGIYLYHPSVRPLGLLVAKHVPAFLQWPAAMTVEYGVAILLGAVMTRVVEWPMLRYRDRVLPQRVTDISSPPDKSIALDPEIVSKA